jgi:hypothetical protein
LRGRWPGGPRRSPRPRNTGFGNGESLTYSVRWGIIPSVGRITIAAEAIGQGPDAVLRVTTTTATVGLARGLFRFDGRGESVYQASDADCCCPRSEWSSYRDKVVKNTITFNYDARMATYTDEIHPKNSRQIRMPPGDPSDLILALIATRNWNIPPGEQRDALVIFQDQFFPLTIRAGGAGLVFTSLGIFKTSVLVPRMEKTPPSACSSGDRPCGCGSPTTMTRHLPVRFEVGFRFGTGTATLLDYSPPK